MNSVYWNQADAVYLSLCFFIFFLSNFQTLKFLSHFSQELCGLQSWNLVHTLTIDGCIMYTRIRLLLLICPFISSFFFLSNFQTVEFFVAFFSGTVRPIKLKLGTHMDSGWMYRVYRNQAVFFLPSSFFFLSNFQTLKIFVTLFSGTVRPTKLKLGTQVDSGWMYCVYWNKPASAYLSLSSFFFLSSFQTSKPCICKIVSTYLWWLWSGVCELVLTVCYISDWMDTYIFSLYCDLILRVLNTKRRPPWQSG